MCVCATAVGSGDVGCRKSLKMWAGGVIYCKPDKTLEKRKSDKPKIWRVGGVGAGVQRKGQRACDEPVRRHFYRRLREIAVTSPEWGGPTALTIWDLDGPSVTS